MTSPKAFKVKDQLIARFTVCVEPAVYNKLTDMARRKKVPRSELVREILKAYIADHQPSGRSREEHTHV